MKQKTKFKQTQEDWEIRKIGEMTEQIFSGGTPDTRKPEYWDGEIPWLSSGETGNRFIRNTERKITKLGVDNSSTRLAKVGDVVVAAAGQGYTRGQASFCMIDTYINQSIVALRVKKEQLNPLFLFYNLLSRYSELRDISDAHSSRGSLTTKLLGGLNIRIPSIYEQENISNILFSIDSKIELNQQMNKTLEAIGLAIFKHWFIDFEFPNEDGKPYKSSGGEMIYNEELGSEIPKEWEVTKMKEVLSLLKDGTHNPPKRVQHGIKFIAGASDIKHFEIDFSGCTYITKEDYEKIHKYFSVEPNDVLLTIVGTIGNVAIVKKSDIPFSLQRSIAVLRPNEKIDFAFLYHMLNSEPFKQFLYASVNPTAQPGIYLGTLSEFQLILPKKEIVAKFGTITGSIINKMQENNSKNRVLSSMRNSLLPKLMSGKIRIPVEA
jgi:type I restriction enzyme S subunit